jgi:two-component system sensor histidine kinase AlgZ
MEKQANFSGTQMFPGIDARLFRDRSAENTGLSRPEVKGGKNRKINQLMDGVDSFLYNDFIFSSRYRIWRHVVYWSIHLIIWSCFWIITGGPNNFSYGRILFHQVLWLPVFLLYSYPLVYWAVPHVLMKEKVVLFFFLMMAWGAAGLGINFAFATYVFVPVQEAVGFEVISPGGLQAHRYLCMTTSAASPVIFKFFKLWTLKQRDWIQAQQEKVTAELQLLKAQIHPHFLFNTLNNIYSFSLENSPKTPDMISKLSSLLNYMLYDCKAEEVRLEKEIQIMKNYIDLEIERYGNRIETTWNVQGSIDGKFISPLLMLPFLENAFKHGLSEQIEKPWLKVDLSVRNNSLRCEIANSKNDLVPYNTNGNGIGIENVKRRLALMYPDSYQLKMRDEGSFFYVSLLVELTGYTHFPLPLSSAVRQTIPT